LFTFEAPPLQATFQKQVGYNIVVPPAIPLFIRFTGALNFRANLAFGFDTSGLKTDGTASDILEGFFIDLRSGRPLFDLQSLLSVEGGVGTTTSFGVSVVLGGAGVSLTGNVGFNPRGLPSDGKLRFSQIQQIWNQGQASFFTASGN